MKAQAKKMGRPPRAKGVTSLQTFIPLEMRNHLTHLAKESEMTRSDFTSVWISRVLDKHAPVFNEMKIQRTHPRSDSGWVLLHVQVDNETNERLRESVKSLDVSMASLLYSLILEINA